MKLSISNIAWDSSQNEKIYNIMIENNFNGLEIAPTKIFTNEPYTHLHEAKNWSRSLFKNYGLEISSMQSIWYGKREQIFGLETERQNLINYTKQAIDFASAIGCRNLVIGCPKNRNINSEKDYDVAIKFFKNIGEYAYNNGTCVSIEANPTIYGTNFINDTNSAIKLVKDVNSNGFKLNLDIGTMIQNNEEANILIDNVYLINHVHISEPYLEKIIERDIHKQMISILKNENYDKFISIEMKEQADIKNIISVIRYLKYTV